MLKNLAANQRRAFSKNLYTVGQISSIFNDLKSKGELLTAILLLEEKERALLLFILQDELFAAVELRGKRFSPIPFSDYFREMSQAKGALHLYLTNPVFFKTFLVLAQKEPNIVATSDILNIEDLLKQIEKKKKEAVLMLKKGGEVNFFYFRNGKLSEGYFENPVEIKKEDAIADQLLVYTYSSGASDPMEVQVYYDLEVSPAVDVEDASLALKEGVEHRLATRPRLVLKQGGKELEKVVDKGVFTLGRDLRSDWTLKDPMVSREHAIIKQNADGFYIEDRGSRNGTFVNKEKITGKKLSNGDEIQIGSCLFYFVEKEGEAKVALSSSAPEERALKEKETVRSQSNGPPLSEWSLEVVEGKEPGKAFKLPAKRLSMGRGKVDIIIDDPKVSRHHADLEWTEKGFVLNDLNSTNGVFVNDVKIDKKLLSAGDIIMVGAARLRIVRQK